jgi:two-component system NtrC family sensor kinase
MREALDGVLAKIAAEATRCGRIVRSVLSFADTQVTERRAHDLNALVSRAVDLARGAAATSAVTFVPAPGLPPVVMNDSEMTQVVINLVDNSLRADSSRVIVRTEVHVEGVALVVEDDGVGIPSADLSRVFDPFYTTRSQRGGTGLGLSISHAIVARHGGELHIESTEGCGTTVVAVLPVNSDGAAT